MPNLAQFHPQIVHFVVVLLLVGVGLRIVSLSGKLTWTNPAATAFLIAGGVASFLGFQSGTDAHGPVERIPGVRAAVIEHEDLGHTTYRIFASIAVLELIAFGLSRKDNLRKFARYTHAVTALGGIYGGTVLYETAEHGGELVYSYGGGPGLRTGKPEDVERLLLAGLYNQSRNDRRAGKLADAASLNAEMVKRWPQDTTIQFLNVESLLLDSKNPSAALAAANKITVAATDARWRTRQVNLKADAFLAMGKRDSAKAVLADASAAFPQNARLKARLDSIK